MATTLSRKNFFERMDVAALRGDQPMDAGYVWTALDNINHCIDEVGRYRVNWMSRTGTDFGWVADGHMAKFTQVGEDDGGYWYTIFPTQPVSAYNYPRYDVRVGVLYAGIDDTTLRISLVTPGVTPPVLSDTAPGVIGSFEATLLAPTTFDFGWCEGLLPARSNRDAGTHYIPAPSYVDGDYSFGSVALVKLIVECVTPIVEGVPYIVGVQVREYLR